ncbi:MAG: zinc-dependent metalloprotease [Planctomycetaceae bacterium]
MVGHTPGLRHNFKASSVYSLAQINSEELKGKKQLAGSVMDYIGTNIRLDSGAIQGDYSMTGVGPYDRAIEYGYTFGDLKPIPGRAWQNRNWSTPPTKTLGDQILWHVVTTLQRIRSSTPKSRFAWPPITVLVCCPTSSRTRQLGSTRYGYEMILSLQTRSTSMMANWIGGAHVNRDKKGDPNGRKPIVVVPADTQRKADVRDQQHVQRRSARACRPNWSRR